MIKYDFSGKKILVTGASSGIGAAICRLLADSNAEVIMVARDAEKLEAKANELGIKKFYPVDLSDVPGIAAKIEAIIAECGPLDGFVHSAGVGTVRPLKMCTYEFMKSIMDINFFSFVEIVRIITKKKNFNPGLNIVGISSVASQEGNQSKTAYCASKAAMASSYFPASYRVTAASYSRSRMAVRHFSICSALSLWPPRASKAVIASSYFPASKGAAAAS